MTAIRSAIVTAAGRGIGAACARELAGRGYRLALLSRSENVMEVGRELDAVAMTGDVTQPGDLARLVAMAREAHGRIDAVVVNTGLSRDAGHFTGRRIDPDHTPDLLAIEDGMWLAMFEMLYLGAVRMARLVTPVMQGQGAGAIVNISAMASREPNGAYPSSSTIRRALDGFAKLYADRYAADGIRMNNLSPGLVSTLEWEAEALQAVPAGRAASPEEVARVAAFLVSDEAAYITGQNIVVDGGLNRSN